jgi:hypothetical protein
MGILDFFKKTERDAAPAPPPAANETTVIFRDLDMP